MVEKIGVAIACLAIVFAPLCRAAKAAPTPPLTGDARVDALLGQMTARLHYISWWSPYISGHAKPWQTAYAHGPTTKLLPSFQGHIAPDGMHFVLDILLAAALLSSVAAWPSFIGRRDDPR
jgi:hypothetical protein